MKANNLIKGAVAGLALAATFTANATILTVFDGIADGVSDFDTTVVNAGGSVAFDIWSNIGSGTSIDRGDYVITQNDGGTAFATTYGSMSGEVIGIDPSGGGSDPRTDPMDYFDSGITFTFDDPINAIGFEVGDWATCCLNPTTDLFISFDGGAPILVASADENSDGQFPSQDDPNTLRYEIFVAAFDDSGEFTEVSFWGNGIGEYLVAGGQVRYTLLEQDSLPPTTPASAPASLLLIIGGAMFAARRRRAN